MQFNIVSIWQEMGFIGRLVTVTLATMSIWSIGAIIERSLTFFLQRSRSRRFAADLAGHLSAGRVKEAFKQASETNSYLGNLVESGLKEWLKPDKLGHEERLHHTRNAMERATLRGVQRLKRGQGVLGTVGSTAPFVGLLGTVMGIVDAFTRMAATGGGGFATVASSIGEALLNTAFGLIVAIPAVIFFNFLVGRTEMATVDMQEATGELADYLDRRPDSAGTGTGAPASKAAAASPAAPKAAAQG